MTKSKYIFQFDNLPHHVCLLLQRDPGYRFRMRATATDKGTSPNSAFIDLEILVVESHKKAPVFTAIPASPILLKENFTDYTHNIASLSAM